MTRWLAVLLLAPALATAAPFELVRPIVHPAPAAGDFFGSAIALRDGRVAVGAPRHDEPGAADAGIVYQIDAATGIVQHELRASTSLVDARLGSSLAASTDHVLAGAPNENSGAPHAGAVHVFDAGSGGHQRVLPNPEPALDDGFGSAVAARDGDVVAGARLDGKGAENAGAAWVVGVGGGVRHALLAPVPTGYDDVGAAVAADGDLVVVGAPVDDTVAANGGIVHVFDAGGARLHTLKPPAPALGDAFGRAVAVSGSTVLVGAPLDEAEGVSDAGAVYVFDLVLGGAPRKLVSPDAQSGGRFGSAVAFHGGDVVVGAPFEDGGTAVVAGAVHVFAPDGTHLAMIPNPFPSADDQFGAVVAADGVTTLVVGAWHDDAGAQDAGAVYVYADRGVPSTTLPPGPTTTVPTTTRPPTTTTTSTTTTTTSTAGVGTTDVPTTTTSGPGSTAAPFVTTTTTTPGGGPTLPPPFVPATTTTLPQRCDPAVPAACDDGDACTTDACGVEGVCTHVELADEAAVTCRLDTLGVLLARAGPVALGGRPAARRLERQLLAARRLVERSVGARGRRAAAMGRRAARVLARFVRAVEKAQARRRMAASVAGDVLAVARDAAARLAAVVPSVRPRALRPG